MALLREIFLQSQHWIYIGNVGRVFLRVIAGGGLLHQTVHLQAPGILASGMSLPAAACATAVVIGATGVFARFASLNLQSLYLKKLAGGKCTRHGEAVPVAGQ